MIPVDTPKDLADALGLLRRLARITQTAVGAELGTTPQRIGVYERGEMTANAKTVIRHLAVLGYRLAIVPLDQDGPETGLRSTLADDHPVSGVPLRAEGAEGGSEGSQAAADSCTCRGKPDPKCVVHHGRQARGPKPPPVGPGCICDGSGRTCPRHGAVI